MSEQISEILARFRTKLDSIPTEKDDDRELVENIRALYVDRIEEDSRLQRIDFLQKAEDFIDSVIVIVSQRDEH